MISLPTTAQHIIDIMNQNGYECYAVGGGVRDLFMGRPTHGWDYTTNAKPEETMQVFPDSFYDNMFGTVGIKIYSQSSVVTEKHTGAQDEKPIDIYEITTYRSEKEYTDFRHPDHIEWGTSLTEDLSRRDFTIDAIATDGKSIIDPYHGVDDLKNHIIRAVGDPNQRFKEDALRMMRAVRIAAQLGFMIDRETTEGMKQNAELLTNIAAERIWVEFEKLLASEYPADGVLLLRNTGILAILLPELDEAFSVGQKSPKRHHMYDVGTHSVMALKHCPSKDPIVRLATLLHDVGKPKTVKVDESGVITFYNHEVVGAKIVKTIIQRLRLSKKDSERIYTLVRWHQFSVDERQTDSAIRRSIRKIGKENIDDMLALRIGDRLGGGARETSWRLELFKKRLEEVQKQPFTVADLQVNGYDVMKEFDCKPGPIVGNILDQLFSEVEAGTLANERELLLTRLHELHT